MGRTWPPSPESLGRSLAWSSAWRGSRRPDRYEGWVRGDTGSGCASRAGAIVRVSKSHAEILSHVPGVAGHPPRSGFRPGHPQQMTAAAAVQDLDQLGILLEVGHHEGLELVEVELLDV